MRTAQRRAERRQRSGALVDLNLVSLIDVFTILIFFLLANSGAVQTLPLQRPLRLPESNAQQPPRQTLVITVSTSEILVQGRKVADVASAAAAPEAWIEPLRAELQALATTPGERAAVTIVGDKSVPYHVLRKVMASAARAAFGEVSFAVRSKDST